MMLVPFRSRIEKAEAVSVRTAEMSRAVEESHDPLSPTKGENESLQVNHLVAKLAMAGSLVLAPFDATRPNLKVLDSGTSDGKSLRRWFRLHGNL